MTTWGAFYHSIAEHMEIYRQSNRRLAQLADLRPGMAVLDLGCGSGLTSLAALEQVPEGLRLYLLDKSPSMVNEARRNVGERAEAYYTADALEAAEQMPEKLDRVLCNLAFWYFSDPEEVLRRLRRALKPTGRLCFTLFGTYFNTGGGVVSPEWALIKVLHDEGMLPRALPEVERLPNQRSIEGTLQGAGFKPFHFEVQEIAPQRADTEPGGELYNLLRLYPLLHGESRQEAAERSVAVLPRLAERLAAMQPRWRVVHFMAQPQISPEEVIMAKFGKDLPLKG